MATIVLSAVGAAVGASMGGGFLGLSSVVIGRAVGAIAGSMIDQAVLGDGSDAVEHGRIDRFRLTGASEGAPIARVYGRMRLGGQVIWASQITEHAADAESGSGKGVLLGGSGSGETEFRYTVSLAIALCEGEITRVGRVWADGEEIAPESLNMRVYTGTETQQPDPKIEAVKGAGNAPAYRGIAYVVLEEIDLTRFGNRVPVLNFEVVRPEQPGETAGIARGTKAVAIIPGTGEYALATSIVHTGDVLGEAFPANENTPLGKSDFAASLDMLTGELPNLEAASLVVSWFGDDLRCNTCQIAPKVERNEDDGHEMPWLVSTLTRANAGLVPLETGQPVYGGTPTDQSVVEAIAALAEAGKAVTFYPFILMTQLAGNALPDPWTDGADQPALPWRGRITLSQAPGREDSPDGTASAAAEVASFFGSAQPGDFTVTGTEVAYTGPAEWSYRRFILHYAHLCKAAGGVSAFLIGSELRGLTQIRGADRSFPVVAALVHLAADVRSILGAGVKISYAADWSEYFGYQPQDGSGDVYFHLDPLWSDDNIDFIGIDNYMPLSDWRDGIEHADAHWGSIYNLDYLKANILGGEGYDWYYHAPEAEAPQRRTPITDGAYGKDWVFRYKDLPNWWRSPHHDRIGQVVPTLAGGAVATITDPSDGRDYVVHTFTESGTLSVPADTDVEVLVVGGGGGGSTAGGGAGGIVQQSVTLGAGTWPVTVGAGGPGIHGGALPRPTPASNGADSSLAGLVALGGGGGAGTDYNGVDGGSGGGAASSSKPANPSNGGAGLQPSSASGGAGFDGGAVTRFSMPYYAAGGGGAGGAGQTEAGTWTFGGVGITTTITGSVLAIGGGGAGGNWTGGTGKAGTHGGGDGGSASLRDATPNTGGGGGGGSYPATGGSGGSGLVVVRYLAPPPSPVEDDAPTDWVPGSKPIWFTEFGCAAIDKGTNQPNKFVDPKSSESGLPKYSTGARDDFIQMQYLRAMTEFWSDPAQNPTDAETGVQMLDMSRAHVWAWDARPFPWFPGRRALWSDGDNYQRGHWLNGRSSNIALATAVREICAGSGVGDIDTSRLWGLLRGYAVDRVTGARNALQPLMLAYGVEAAERDGRLEFFTRTGLHDRVLDPACLALTDDLDGTLEFTRAPEAEIAGRVRLSFVESSAGYETRATEAVFPDEPTRSVSQSELPLVLTQAEAQAITERWLAEARMARDTARFALPPSETGARAGDVVRLDLPGGAGNFRIDHVEQAGLSLVQAVRLEPSVFTPAAALDLAVDLGAYTPPVPVFAQFLDLPLLNDEQLPHAPHLAVTARPWPGRVAVYRGVDDASYQLKLSLGAAARLGVSETVLARARTGIVDNGPALRVRLTSGSLSSALPERVLNGANLAAIGGGSARGWEVFQFTDAVLVEENLWEITGRLRGQAGSDADMPEAWPVGSYVIILDGAVQQVPTEASLRGLARDYRIGPAARPLDDAIYVHQVQAFDGIGLRPLSPVHLAADWTTGGALALSWIRRTRIDGDSWLAEDVPLGETSEKYRVRVMQGLSVLRETDVTAPAWTYSAAMRAADGAPASFAVEVAQVSDSFGPGPYRRIEVTV